MKKVIYSITRLGKAEKKFTGIGFVDENKLLVADISKNGNPFIRVYDCQSSLKQVDGKDDEFKGTCEETFSGNDGRYFDITYYIWLKLAK